MSCNTDLLATLGLPSLPSTSPDTVAGLVWAREALQKHTAITYGVQDPKGIDELKAVNIGGVDQWLHIRGRNRNNPILLYLHGGPGFPMIGWGWGDATFRPWEDYFTVVHWDQRQTGKSYYPADDQNNPLTVSQFISDTEEVIQHLRAHLSQEKLFILGHSWGSVLGMHMVKRHPDWLHAYIGVGQVVNTIDNCRVQHGRLLHQAQEKNNSELAARLEAIAPYPDPNNPAKSFAENVNWMVDELASLSGEAAMHHLASDQRKRHNTLSRLISPYLTATNISNALFGGDVALVRDPSHFTAEFMNIDLQADVGSSFEVPIFFFSGTHDWQTPVSLSDKWFDEIQAPHKELIHFEESAHFIVNEEPGKFLVNLVNKVLPLAKATSCDASIEAGQ